MAFRTSPGFETRDQSIFGFASASARPVDALLALPPRLKCARTRSASSASSELECVFFSVTPTSVNTSRIALLFTSSSRARSLIRTLLIRPFCFSIPSPQLFIATSCLWKSTLFVLSPEMMRLGLMISDLCICERRILCAVLINFFALDGFVLRLIEIAFPHRVVLCMRVVFC